MKARNALNAGRFVVIGARVVIDAVAEPSQSTTSVADETNGLPDSVRRDNGLLATGPKDDRKGGVRERATIPIEVRIALVPRAGTNPRQ
jgi:hypothetical protein